VKIQNGERTTPESAESVQPVGRIIIKLGNYSLAPALKISALK
jgi:hypothetical protein